MSDRAAFFRPFDTHAIPSEGTHRHIEAEAAERAALARECGLLDLSALSGDLDIRPWKGEGLLIEGRVKARLTQACVVSLAPVDQEIDEPFTLRLVPEGHRLAVSEPEPGQEVFVDLEEDETPDVFSGHTIDLGAILAEYFALAIDPYPRAPGAELPSEIKAEQAEGGEKPESPFAVLSRLKNGGKKD